MPRINQEVYDTLVRVSLDAYKAEQQMYKACDDGIRAAAETDLEEFDTTIEYLEDTFKARGTPIPLALETLKLVVHEAHATNVPLLDELGMPRRIGAIQASLQSRKSKKPTRQTTKKKRRSRRV
jgi:hypothetical protein